MKIYTVWTSEHTGVNEKCLLRDDGDFVGVDTGTVYSKEKHYCSNQINGKIIAAGKKNLTGMYHLFSELGASHDNKRVWKQRYIGCLVTLEEAHWYGEHRVYRCNELNEYFYDDEVEIFL